jgi:hypothetical protein
MNKLLEQVEGAPADAAEGPRIVSTLRVHIKPFRGDVAGEAYRVRELAKHFGGKVLTPPPPAPRPGIVRRPIAPPKRRVITCTIRADHVHEFVQAVQLGTRPPRKKATQKRASPRSSGRTKSLAAAEQRPQPRVITVEVTIGEEADAAPRR